MAGRGSPDAEKMWEAAGGKSPQTVRGKKLWAALKTIAKANGEDNKKLDHFTIPSDVVIASDLKFVIESVISAHLLDDAAG